MFRHRLLLVHFFKNTFYGHRTVCSRDASWSSLFYKEHRLQIIPFDFLYTIHEIWPFLLSFVLSFFFLKICVSVYVLYVCYFPHLMNDDGLMAPFNSESTLFISLFTRWSMLFLHSSVNHKWNFKCEKPYVNVNRNSVE